MFTNCCRKQTNVDPDIVKKNLQQLDKYNTHAQCFRQAREKLKQEPTHNLKLQLIFDNSTDGRIYNISKVSKIAIVIVGDVYSASHMDIIVEKESGKLQRINELHPS